MRWAELSLFLVPFALFAAWRLSVLLARPAVVWVALGLAVTLAAGTAAFGVWRRVPAGERYVPARIEGGKIVPGAGVAK
jgi:ABC-type uncharacterized transport system permease subunit